MTRMNSKGAIDALISSDVSKETKVNITTEIMKMESEWRKEQKMNWGGMNEVARYPSPTAIESYACTTCGASVYQGEPQFEEELCENCYEELEGEK